MFEIFSFSDLGSLYSSRRPSCGLDECASGREREFHYTKSIIEPRRVEEGCDGRWQRKKEEAKRRGRVMPMGNK